jgi:hypothetical protein
LAREDVLSKGWERLLVPNVALPRITNASGRRMSARGVIVLFVQVGGLLKRVRFYVTPGLAVPCILGCGFINLYVKTIHLELTEGGSVAISNRPYACGAAAVSVRKPTPSTKVRLARPTIVQPRWEAHVEATTAVEVLCLLLQHSRPSTGPVTLASGVADIRSHVPFRVRVLNPSMRSQILPMGMVIGLASLQPEQIILIDEPHAVKPPDISFPWPEHQERDMRKDMAPPSTEIDIESHPRDNILTKSWKDDVHLDHLDSTEQKPCWTC